MHAAGDRDCRDRFGFVAHTIIMHRALRSGMPQLRSFTMHVRSSQLVMWRTFFAVCPGFCVVLRRMSCMWASLFVCLSCCFTAFSGLSCIVFVYSAPSFLFGGGRACFDCFVLLICDFCQPTGCGSPSDSKHGGPAGHDAFVPSHGSPGQSGHVVCVTRTRKNTSMWHLYRTHCMDMVRLHVVFLHDDGDSA